MAIHAPITGAPLRAPLSDRERQVIEAQIERLIEILDIADGDPDLEDSETASVWVDARGRGLRDMSHIRTEDDEDSCDEEPDDTPAKLEHRDRIRLTRCEEVGHLHRSGRFYSEGFRLRDEPVVPPLDRLHRRHSAVHESRI